MKKFLALVPALLLAGITLFAQADKRIKEFNISKSALAISGFDPMAYFTQNKAIKGNKNNSVV